MGTYLLYKTTVFLAAALTVGAAVEYARWTWRGKTQSSPATWILMMGMMLLGSWMYWSNPRHSLTGNVGLLSGAINVFIILVTVLIRRVRDGTIKELAFDPVQRFCLIGGAVIVTAWLATDRSNTFLSYVFVQLLGVVAYGATARRLWRATTSTEPYFLWVCTFLSCLSALYPAIVKHDVFSWIYLGRATPSTLGMILLLWRIKHRAPTT